MLTIDALRTMTGPEILAYNEQHPGELDALAAEVQGWGTAQLENDLCAWYGADGQVIEYTDLYHPTIDANQTRKLVTAVPEDRRPAYGKRLKGYMLQIYPTLQDAADDGTVWAYVYTDAPLPLVTAAAVLAMGGDE